RVFAREFTGKRYDTGNKLGYLTTNIEFGLQHPEIRDELRDYIIKLGHKLSQK
ncbi:MAG: UTP--glucose-1-phosphate uridylyltransferase, partial [Lactiplantibacillus plantarum]|nr:UTP--glucose-1-phosphate uridylyltransferase [Lactiplantibacillus plantarum]